MPLHLTPQISFSPTMAVDFFGKPESFSHALGAVANLERFTHIIKLDQVHGTHCAVLNKPEQLIVDQDVSLESKPQQLPPTPLILTIPQADACVTTLPNVLLSVKVADCAPILLVGAAKDAQTAKKTTFVGVVHAGRKGTNAGILTETFQTIIEQLGEVSKLTAWFGPAICAQCYEINQETQETYDLLAQNQAQFADFWRERTATQAVMHHSGHCTLHEPEHFYSYRRTGAGTPMNFGFVGKW